MRLIIALIILLIGLANNQIIVCQLGCAVCQINNRLICNACQKGHQLNTAQKCVKSPETAYCSLHSINVLLCQQCHPTFRVRSGKCEKDFSGCINYNIKNICTKCDFGKMLINNTCIGTLNCKTYNNSICLQCKNNYNLFKNICYYNQKSCNRIDRSSGACMNCTAGFKLIGFQCIEINITSRYCYIYDSQGLCLYCKIGYFLYNNQCIIIPTCTKKQYLSQQYTCEKLPDKCASVNTSTLQCQKCNNNYELDNSTCIPNLPENCIQLSFSGDCKNCSQRYYPYNFTCKAVSKYCRTYNAIGHCLNCTFQYFINFKGLCRDPFCLNMNQNQCLQCRQHYTFDNETGKCLLTDNNCKYLSQTKCLQCHVGFYITNSICHPLPQNCLSASNNGQCINCSRTFYLQRGKCFLINQTIQNCKKYSQISSVSKCLVCELGFMISLGKCLQIPPFCSLLLSNGKCAMCQNGYLIKSGKCQKQDKINNILDNNCLNYSNNRCIRCSSNSILGINGICYRRQLNQCQSYNYQNQCILCKNGSFLSSNQCILGILIDLNCKQYRHEICIQCYPGFYINQNKCNLPNYNCSRFNTTNGGCIACFSGFILTNFQCILQTKINNCLSYDNLGNCQQCARMFYIQNNTCIKVNFLCQNYNPFTGSCTSCFPGYGIEGKDCVKNNDVYWSKITNLTVVCKLKKGSLCIECPQRYYLRDNVCILVNGNCLTYNSNGNCLSCIIGSFFSNYNCLSYGSLNGADPNCKSFQNQFKCLECYTGHIVIEGKCQTVNPLCKTHDPKKGYCQSCYDGYSIVDKSCSFSGEQTVINPCLQVDRDNKCLSCIITYYINNGTCKYNESIVISSFNIPFCKVAFNTSFCEICDQGFYPRQGNCYQVSIYCKDYNPLNGQCLSCKQQYIYQNKQCIYPALGKDRFCQEYAGVYCSKCTQGYYLKDYICRKINPFCLNFNTDINQCLQCSQGKPIFDICN